MRQVGNGDGSGRTCIGIVFYLIDAVTQVVDVVANRIQLANIDSIGGICARSNVGNLLIACIDTCLCDAGAIFTVFAFDGDTIAIDNSAAAIGIFGGDTVQVQVLCDIDRYFRTISSLDGCNHHIFAASGKVNILTIGDWYVHRTAFTI